MWALVGAKPRLSLLRGHFCETENSPFATRMGGYWMHSGTDRLCAPPDGSLDVQLRC